MKKALAVILAVLGLALCSTQASAQASSGFTKITNVSGGSYIDSSCPLQSTCYYQVTAVDANGFESGPATCASAQLCVGGNTAAAIMPSSGTHTVTVNWVAPGGTGLTYNVYRHIGPLPTSGLSTTVN